MKIRKGDMIEVVAGDDKGRRAKVLEVLPKRSKLLVEGVNQVYKHLRRDRKNPQGGRLQKEAPVDASNARVVCPKCNAGVRVGYQTKTNGTKVRVCKKCNAEIGTVS